MKAYYGIIFSAVFALIFRVLVEFKVLEINSWTYLILIPIIIGYIPLFLEKKVFVDSKLKAILFPTISVFLFLVIAFITRMEDLGCFILLIPPYLIISIIVSLSIRYSFRIKDEETSNKINKNSLFLFIIPILLGNAEKRIEKKRSNFDISKTIVINVPKEKIWNNLYSVPNLTNFIENSAFNYFGFPNPTKSTFDRKTNTRLGYFDNGIILNENVTKSTKFKDLTFKINVDKSNLEESPTFKHILKNENLVFNEISYYLKPLNENKTELTLKCNYDIKSNIPFYGEFWSKQIIEDFENKLLTALKKQNENLHCR